MLLNKPNVPNGGLYDLVFTERGFFRGGRYDKRWHEPYCEKGEDCTCSLAALEQHYADGADLEMDNE